MAGIEIAVGDGQKLLTWLKKGNVLSTLANLTLPSPLTRVSVIAQSSNDEASLAAMIFVPFPNPANVLGSLFGGPSVSQLPPAAHLREAFKVQIDDDATYVLNEQGKRFGGVVPGPLPNQITAFVGDLPLLQWTTRPLRLSTADVLIDEIKAFNQIVIATIEGLYLARNVPIPNVRIMLKPGSGDPDTLLRDAADRVGKVIDPSRAPATGAAEPIERPLQRFSDVGGQEAAVHALRTVALSLQVPERFKEWGVRPPKGILLHGPPGTGKTLLARCLAGETNAAFFHVRTTDVTSKWYGEAEQRLRAMFDRALATAPAIIFIDELDALAPAREGAHEATQRIVGTLLEFMDGLEESAGVVVVAATNRPAALDPALVRPGRFDRAVEVGMPNTAGRVQILHIHAQQAEQRAGRTLFNGVDWDLLASESDGQSGADLAEVIRRALEARVHGKGGGALVSTADLLHELNGLKARAF